MEFELGQRVRIKPFTFGVYLHTQCLGCIVGTIHRLSNVNKHVQIRIERSKVDPSLWKELKASFQKYCYIMLDSSPHMNVTVRMSEIEQIEE